MLFDLTFWKLAAERAVGAAAVVIVTVLAGVHNDAFKVDWQQTAGLVVGAVVASVAASLAKQFVGPTGTPSVID